MIKVYSTPTCAYCHALKEFLREHNIDFTDIDVSQDQQAAEELVHQTNQYGVPVIDINGQMIIGFNRQKICQELKIEE
ncbi:MAG TPA: NrdH-redoxin [Candidatus Portnoybacteria bacterium]|nr:NrdH-redoxin [Candidatus Portnoybacteria bacterium]